MLRILALLLLLANALLLAGQWGLFDRLGADGEAFGGISMCKAGLFTLEPDAERGLAEHLLDLGGDVPSPQGGGDLPHP